MCRDSDQAVRITPHRTTPSKDDVPGIPCLPIGLALTGVLARSGVNGSDILSVVGCQPTSSALRVTSRLPVSSFSRVRIHPRLVVPLPWSRAAGLTSHGISSVGSPQVRTRVSTTQPPHLPAGWNRTVSSRRAGLTPSERPFMRFLFIGSWLSLSLPPDGRLPFRP